MTRTILRGALALTLSIGSTGCSSVAKGFGEVLLKTAATVAVAVVAAGVNEAVKPGGSNPSHTETTCERERREWRERYRPGAEDGDAPPSHRCTPRGDFEATTTLPPYHPAPGDGDYPTM